VRIPIALLLVLLVGCVARRPPIYGLIEVDEGRVMLDVRGQVVPIKAPAAVLEQLARVEGGRVEIDGSASRVGVRVKRWHLTEGPDGLPALYGRVVRDQGGLFLDDTVSGGRVALMTDGGLGERHGDLVWLTGTSWGVLQEAE
jgi:hypothetical protein